ncbi:tail fiber domain-containing protein [Devosia aquimaris]|uniref:tail fiber domain-containing protein n=1 Tax=Devosia aquimaris TaxID=2866214 RepID=UPI001CD0D4EE|nr:hypothetical protein [Devosia sp. CJK-A8-3]
MALTIDDVWRDYNTRGVPASGDYKPSKSEIRRLLKQMFGGTAAVGDFQGAWAIGTSYITADYVENGGSLWLAKRGNIGVTPIEGDDWTLLLPGVTVADATVTDAKVAAGVAAAKINYLLPATGAQTRTVQSRLTDMVSVFDFMTPSEVASVKARDGLVDVTAAINAAVASGHSVTMLEGLARCDGMIIIGPNQSLTLGPAARLKRFALKADGATAGSQFPVVHVKGNWARFSGGSVESLCNSPSGVVCCGHLDSTTSNYNSLFWRFENCDVYCKDFGGAAASPYPNFAQGIGVYVPSSQPNLGNSTVNYFGLISNITVYNGTTNLYLTDLANSHTIQNFRSEFFYHHAIVLSGAYGNSIYGTFLNGSYKDDAEAIYLTTKSYPAAPYASSLQSNYNNIFGLTSELYTDGCVTLKVDADCQNNFVQIGHNSGGAVYWTDLDGANTILEPHKNQMAGQMTLRGHLYPGATANFNLGSGTSEWNRIYLVNAPIVSSDRALKQDVDALNERELLVARAIPGLVRRYRLTREVDVGAAGFHIGLIAQDVALEFSKHGLNAAHYDLISVDPETGRMALRYEELAMMAIAGLAA